MQTADGFAAAAAPPPLPAAQVTVGARTWSIGAAGEVLVSSHGQPPSRDPGSPDLGAGAHLIAAPLATPGLVDRRQHLGDGLAPVSRWRLVGLAGPAAGHPGHRHAGVTGLAAFNTIDVSAVVYLGTDGYGTLLTSDGGDDWVRADPGLPDGRARASPPTPSGAAPAIWAATTEGLYVHRLQAIPSIPNYAGGSLTGKWLATIALGLGVILLAGLALVAWSRRWPVAGGDKAPT